MKLSEIIKNYRKSHKVSMETLANRAGLSKTYISFIENGANSTTGKPIKPTVETLMRLSSAMGITLDDMIHMLDGDTIISLDGVTPLEDDNIIFDDYFPLHYCTNLSAGSLDELLDNDYDAIVYVPIKYQSKRNNLHAFKVNGDSMNNVIQDGSIVVTETVDISRIKNGSIVVAFIDGMATVKRIFVSGDIVTLSPDSTNRSHVPITINTSETPVSIIGKVIWHMNSDNMEKYYL